MDLSEGKGKILMDQEPREGKKGQIPMDRAKGREEGADPDGSEPREGKKGQIPMDVSQGKRRSGRSQWIWSQGKRRRAKKLGITDVPAEVVTFISHATQNRLRTVIEKVTVITQHRMESYKDDEWYEQATDVRSQLKFFEQLERLEKQRKDEQEREILLKAAKMQQQELAQMRQRDANLTALAAIGPRKKRRLDAPGLLTIGGEISARELAELGTEVDHVYTLKLT
ncbi:hypothetical protein DUI87_13945 [Hirundo rustica rustica]|uniref:Transcription initiation factor TFIID component TAF4 C-terminal domain-containing protein n=1 Tax=Hirundo rustica rustica TaxID=333673 RepID=A0A3M0KCX7_HIRRU|nr:hypothetical protein DUI87_13945 [Hirundo rustica rustica]